MTIGRDRARGCLISVELHEVVTIERDRARGCLISVELQEAVRIGREREQEDASFLWRCRNL